MKTIIFTIIICFQPGYLLSQWSEQISGVSATLYAVSAADNNNVWVCGSGGVVLQTTNGGENWNQTSTPNSSLSVYTIYAVSRTTALLAGSSSSSYLYRTTNSGVNWILVFTEPLGFINAIGGLQNDTNNLFMVGDPVGGRWSLWKSSNGGITWDSSAGNLRIPQNGSDAGFINSLYMGYGYIWFGTINERIYRIDNTGYTFQPTAGLMHIYGIWFNDPLTGMAGASSMVATSNSGVNWTSLAVPGSGIITGITGISSQWWFTKGNSVYYSSNNGSTWSASTTQAGFYYHITKARAENNNNIWAIRQNGGISKLNYIIGIQPVNNIVPKDFSLSQNYPNPFNPSTKIRFEIPAGQREHEVKLFVYDITGRTAAELINCRLQPGTYETEFNGSHLASGIYFYRLTAGGFTSTKKMLIIK